MRRVSAADDDVALIGSPVDGKHKFLKSSSQRIIVINHLIPKPKKSDSGILLEEVMSNTCVLAKCFVYKGFRVVFFEFN